MEALDFDRVCMLLAALATIFAVERYRAASIIMFLNFAISDIAAVNILILLDGAKSYPLHIVYVLISGLTIGGLVKAGSLWPLYVSIFVFLLYNLAVLSEFIWFPVGFHANYESAATVQVSIELAMLFIMSKGCRYVCNYFNHRTYDVFIDRFFFDSSRLGNQGAV